MTEEVILPDDPRAAQPHTMRGWRSRNGLFFADEYIARYAGSTHSVCKQCGKPSPKAWTLCQPCMALKEEAVYDAMPRAEWDGKAMLYSLALEKYYSEPGEAWDEVDEDAEEDAPARESLAWLRLVICEPVYARKLDEDFFEGQTPTEDDYYELPDEVGRAMDAFNSAVDGIVLSWKPGKIALQD